MARRRRAVEKAAYRRKVTDRIVGVVLVVVALSGLMSVLPGFSQRAVSRTACRVVTVGLGTCGAPGLDLSDTTLAPPRCLILARLDDVLPEVRVRRLVTTQGLPVTIATARSGDVVVRLGDAPQPDLPRILDGATRPSIQIVNGVSVPSQVEWYLPRGQGLDDLVGAAQDEKHQLAQDRSALALLGSTLDSDERKIPDPTLLYSAVDLREQVWPRLASDDTAPPLTSGSTTAKGPVRSSSLMTVQPGPPGVLSYNRIVDQSALTVSLSGTVGGRPATGSLRVTRDAAGNVTGVLMAVVTQRQIVPGEPRTSLPGPAVAYIEVPVQTPTERALVASWLAGSAPVAVPLDELLGLRTPLADDRLGSFLTRAATVTVLRYALVEPGALQARVADELRTGRREDWEGIRLVEVASVAPTANGAGRRLESDPGCRT